MDPSSSANLNEFKTTLIELELDVDFNSQTLSGVARLTLKNQIDLPNKIILDGRALQIKEITCSSTLSKLNFSIKTISAELGDAITIKLTEKEQDFLKKNPEIIIEVNYSTSPSASGLQWLPPEQTEGKNQPYMFSQFQAIHCRSAIPCQDSPSSKCPFKSQISIPQNLVCLMSGKFIKKIKNEKNDKFIHFFEQKLPIPSYLIAFVVGDIVEKEIGKRSKVYTERELLEKSAFEFSETENFLQTAESFLTPYEWERYDLLILPSSFPYGGMENPTLTFVTPTLLAGDRSLALVVAHEIAHSWTGNLVTNVNWEHFWLNEGLTVFSERKILQKLKGKQHRDLLYLIGQKHLTDSIKELSQRSLLKFTSLVHSLGKQDPDDAFSSVPYERGSQFLFYLQNLVSEQSFEDFIKEWISFYKFKNVNSEDFKNFFTQKFPEVSKKVEWDAWYYGTGQPPVNIKDYLDLTLSENAVKLAKIWIDKKDTSFSDIKEWSGTLLEFFLGYLNENANLSLETTKLLRNTYQLSKSSSSEIKNLWAHLIIKAEYEEEFEFVIRFLKSQGRMKFTRPLYRALYNSKKGKELAISTFKEWKTFYHPIAQKMISIDLKLNEKDEKIK